jgi:hypothetical protein
MTANQMWDNVLVTYDALYSQSAPGFEDAEATILLTKAQWYYILQRLNPKSNRNMEGFEETEIRIQGLSALIKDSQDAVPPIIELPQQDQTGTLPGEKLWALPVDFMITIYEGSVTNVPQCGTTSTYNRIMTIPISHDEYNLNYYNPYKKPYTDGTEGIVWRLEHGKKTVNGVERKIHGLITDGTPQFQVTNYYMRYLKTPNDIVVNLNNPSAQISCELDSLTHQGICDIALKLLAAAVREQIPITQLTADSLE